MQNPYRVTAIRLNLRLYAGVDAPKSGYLVNGDLVDILEVLEVFDRYIWVKAELMDGDVLWCAAGTADGRYTWLTQEPIGARLITPEQIPPADGFDSPVGTEQERAGSGKMWPGTWQDVNPYGTRYHLRGYYPYHTGADLNNNSPHWDADRHAKVFAIAHGSVTAAKWYPHWGNIVILRHLSRIGEVFSRYAHLGEMTVREGEIINRGDQLGTVGRDAYNGPYHLHFDISITEVLSNKPNDWPGGNAERISRDYTDPKRFIEQYRII